MVNSKVKWQDEELELVDFLLDPSHGVQSHSVANPIVPQLQQSYYLLPPIDNIHRPQQWHLSHENPSQSQAISQHKLGKEGIEKIVKAQKARNRNSKKGLTHREKLNKINERMGQDLDELYAIVPDYPEPSPQEKLAMFKEGKYRELIPFLKNKSARYLSGARENVLKEIAEQLGDSVDVSIGKTKKRFMSEDDEETLAEYLGEFPAISHEKVDTVSQQSLENLNGIQKLIESQRNEAERVRTKAYPNKEAYLDAVKQRREAEIQELYSFVPDGPEPSFEEKQKIFKDGRFRELVPYITSARKPKSLSGVRIALWRELFPEEYEIRHLRKKLKKSYSAQSDEEEN